MNIHASCDGWPSPKNASQYELHKLDDKPPAEKKTLNVKEPSPKLGSILLNSMLMLIQPQRRKSAWYQNIREWQVDIFYSE